MPHVASCPSRRFSALFIFFPTGFWDMTSLRVHTRNFHSKEHEKEEPFCCSVCGKTFRFDFSYEAHLNSHEMFGQTVPKMAGASGHVSKSPRTSNTETVPTESLKTTTAELLTPDGESREIVLEIVSVPEIGDEDVEGAANLETEVAHASAVKLEDRSSAGQQEQDDDDDDDDDEEEEEEEEEGEESEEEMPPPPLAVINGNNQNNAVEMNMAEPSPSSSQDGGPPDLPCINKTDAQPRNDGTISQLILPPLESTTQNMNSTMKPTLVQPAPPPKPSFDLSDDDDDDDDDDAAPTLPNINEQPLNGNPRRAAADVPPKLDPVIFRPRSSLATYLTSAPCIQASNRPKKEKKPRKLRPPPLIYDFVMSEEKPFQCEICMEKFRWEISLTIHKRDKHTVGGPPKVVRSSRRRAGGRRGGRGRGVKQDGSPVAMSQILRSRASSDEEDDYDAMDVSSPDTEPVVEQRRLRRKRAAPQEASAKEGNKVTPAKWQRSTATLRDSEDCMEAGTETSRIQAPTTVPFGDGQDIPSAQGAKPRHCRGMSKKPADLSEADLENNLVEDENQSPNNEIDAYMREFEELAQKQVEEETRGQDSDAQMDDEEEEEDDEEEEETENEEEMEEEEEEEMTPEVQQSLPRTFTAHIRWTDKLHRRRAAYVCKFCTKIFSCKQSCQIHQLRHTGRRGFACTDCDSKFPDSASLVVHRVQHTWSDPLACGLCAKMCASARGLAQHIFTHRSLKSSPCPRCRKLLVTASAYERHLASHEARSPVQSYSNNGLEAVNFAPGMYPEVPQEIAAPYSCDICHKGFVDRTKFEEHQSSGCIFSTILYN